MTPNVAPPNASLGVMLHARALSTSAIRLTLDLILGGAVSAAAIWFRPSWWLQLASAGLCFAMYGAWAFAERHLESAAAEISRPAEIVWGAFRGLTAAAGMIAAVTLACSVAAATLGNWIS
jgi:hypothetical protein